MRLTLIALLMAGCSESTIFVEKDAEAGLTDGQIRGRVCSADGRNWQADAMAYTNLFDSEGRLYDTVIAYTDLDGYFQLDDLPAEAEYDVKVVYGADYLLEETVYVGDGEVIELDTPDCFDPLELDVAVVSGDYDDFELVLSNMGFANYEVINGQDEAELRSFLLDPDAMSQYDVIFFNGGFVEDGIIYGGEDETVSFQVMSNIVDYVTSGGAIYASDWAYDVVEQGWPDAINFVGTDEEPDAAQLGEYGFVTAAVSDSAMAEWLGSNYIDVEYDLPVWPPMEQVDDAVSIHLTGTIDYREGTSTYTLSSVPMLVSFTAGEGRVTFSTFRVAKNASTDMMLVLQYMMYNL